MTAGETQRVLLVEDDPIGRAAVAEYLAAKGFTILQAANAFEALALLNANINVVAILSDIHLPGPMNGIALAWEVRRHSPNMPMTLISGAAQPHPATLPPGVVFIEKPCLASAIAAEVARMVKTSHAT